MSMSSLSPTAAHLSEYIWTSSPVIARFTTMCVPSTDKLAQVGVVIGTVEESKRKVQTDTESNVVHTTRSIQLCRFIAVPRHKLPDYKSFIGKRYSSSEEIVGVYDARRTGVAKSLNDDEPTVSRDGARLLKHVLSNTMQKHITIGLPLLLTLEHSYNVQTNVSAEQHRLYRTETNPGGNSCDLLPSPLHIRNLRHTRYDDITPSRAFHDTQNVVKVPEEMIKEQREMTDKLVAEQCQSLDKTAREANTRLTSTKNQQLLLDTFTNDRASASAVVNHAVQQRASMSGEEFLALAGGPTPIGSNSLTVNTSGSAISRSSPTTQSTPFRTPEVQHGNPPPTTGYRGRGGHQQNRGRGRGNGGHPANQGQ